MKIYSIYENLQEQNNSLIIIKQGFSLWALIFNFIWAIYNKMWGIALITIVVHLVIISLMQENNIIASAMNIATMLFIFGFFATEMQEYYANKKGYKLSDIILANNEEEAAIKYFVRSNYTNN